MKNKLTAGFIASAIIFSLTGSALALSLNLDSHNEAKLNASARAAKEGGKTLGDRLARLQFLFETQVKRLENRMEKQKVKLAAKFEKKEEKLERKENHATTTPLMLEIGQSGHVFMRGFVQSVSASGSLTVKSWGGIWTVKTDEHTTINSENHLFSDFHAGDYAAVIGKVDENANLTVNASLIKDRTE